MIRRNIIPDPRYRLALAMPSVLRSLDLKLGPDVCHSYPVINGMHSVALAGCITEELLVTCWGLHAKDLLHTSSHRLHSDLVSNCDTDICCLSFDRQHLQCLSGGKRGDRQNCSV